MQKRTGDRGEDIAARFLSGKGFEIAARNYHSRFGEIDIIAVNDKYIVFAEVKTRNINSFGTGAEYVGPDKQIRIIKTAFQYLNKYKTDLQPRFDVIEIEYDRVTSALVNIRHIENAFDGAGDII